jgi:hypothetical protein
MGRVVAKRNLPGLDAFTDLAKRLARVSKAELDAEERKYKAMRKRLKAKKEKRRRDEK